MFQSLVIHFRNILIATGIFVIVVAGGTYYFQSSLILVKHWDPYTHWAAVLFGLPVLAGLIKRFAHFNFPVISCGLGTLLSASILYPQYKTLWAVPPNSVDITIYMIIVFGIGYIATQPLKKTFMMAFRIGRYSIPRFSSPHISNTSVTESKKPSTQKTKTGGKANTQAVSTQSANFGHGNVLAMMELLIGICSLALTIFSVFFLGRS